MKCSDRCFKPQYAVHVMMAILKLIYTFALGGRGGGQKVYRHDKIYLQCYGPGATILTPCRKTRGMFNDENSVTKFMYFVRHTLPAGYL